MTGATSIIIYHLREQRGQRNKLAGNLTLDVRSDIPSTSKNRAPGM